MLLRRLLRRKGSLAPQSKRPHRPTPTPLHPALGPAHEVPWRTRLPRWSTRSQKFMPVSPLRLPVLTATALYSDFDIPIEDLAAHIAVAEALETTRPVPAPSSPPPSPPTEVRRGRKGWKADVQGCMRRWGKRGVVQGYAGIEATIEREWWICVVLIQVLHTATRTTRLSASSPTRPSRGLLAR
jgi:hypothetical protein